MSERAHLLIVDDDREIRGLLAQYLEKHDFRTTAVADGKEMRRRAAHAPRDPSPESVRGFCFGGWRLDTVTRTLTDAAGRVVALSGAEYRLLAVLLGAGNRVLSRTQLTELLRGRDADPFD